jgi:hypothetical protein
LIIRKVYNLKENDLIVIQSVLEEFFEKEFIVYDKNEQTFNCPACTILFEDDLWKISYDYAFTVEPHYLVMATIIGKVFAEEDIDFEVYEGYYSVYNDVGICITTLCDSDVWYYAAEHEIEYMKAKDILIEQMKKEYNKEDLH